MLQIHFDAFPATQTARLDLRAFVPSDAEELFAIRSHPEVLRYLDKDPDPDVDAVRTLINRLQTDFEQGQGLAWAIRRIGHPELLGSIGIWRFDHKNHRGEVGYLLNPTAWGQGYMHEAMQHVLQVAFHQIKLHSLEANTAVGNVASHALLERCGFVKEAHFRENWYYNGKFSDSVIYCRLTDLP